MRFTPFVAFLAICACAPTLNDAAERSSTVANATETPREQLDSSAAVEGYTAPLPEVAFAPTIVRDATALTRLRENSGITLQWIGWDMRGPTMVTQNGNAWWFWGQQTDRERGEVVVEGRIAEIGADYFILDGEITINGAPDAGRFCRATRTDWRFAITQDRKYWRLREFEWCDGLTDYIDIYF